MFFSLEAEKNFFGAQKKRQKKFSALRAEYQHRPPHFEIRGTALECTDSSIKITVA